MAATPPTRLLTYLGLVAWGDLGPYTIYRSHRARIVWVPKSWPAKPPSPLQILQRAAYRSALLAWLAKPAAYKAQWHLAARRASLCMHGLNLYLHAVLTQDTSAIATLERQTATTLLPL